MNRKLTIKENAELAEYNREIEKAIFDAERTRTSALIHDHDWRDDITVGDMQEIGRQLEKYRNK